MCGQSEDWCIRMKELVEKGAGGVEFRRIVVEVKLLNPFKNFSLDVQSIEYRKDPLLDRWARINMLRASRMKQTEEKDEKLFEKMVKESKVKCLFCPERVLNGTPMFTSELVDSGRFKRNTFILFPNLFPFAKYHGVGIISEDHHLELNSISQDILRNCLVGCKDFFKLIASKDPDARYITISLNHLPPAGASIVHPHVQIIQDYKPTTMLEKALKASENYYKNYGSYFWDDLVESEKILDKRFISSGNVLDWIASFAPLADKEVIGIYRLHKECFTDLSNDKLAGMAKDISTMLSLLYNKLGVKSINMSIYSAPIGLKHKHFRVHVRIISRVKPTALYTNDMGFMEILQAEPVVPSLPETTAHILRDR